MEHHRIFVQLSALGWQPPQQLLRTFETVSTNSINLKCIRLKGETKIFLPQYERIENKHERRETAV